MAVVRVVGIRGLEAAMRRDFKKLRRAVVKGAQKAAQLTKVEMADKIPVAFGELKESLIVENLEDGGRAVVEAPYAQAVESGSRPHWVPLDALIAWVKLRAAQGLTSSGKIRSLRSQALSKSGPTTKQHAYSIAKQVRAKQRSGKWNATEDIIEIAEAIQHSIAAHGIKPSFFALRTLAHVDAFLDAAISQAVQKFGP